ncbi:arsenate reductase (glutaredoxin) [Aquimarina sp. 2201CG5-10]|uniref:arsenate reductase (glutaredoxin) n=1 Tax=Aquimarina callyspongiae TaxID=3098150 RepID=UPI002AB34C3B|nr:arsenate reductase (glutaredoxin) [Aquimarina sp. 2201CG5-10]MDY8135526.1 arsenate reductase (glutaredoxin) [Aquimarina sp. 2201CG5-10]
MATIYHNPRCSKSRETLSILEEQNEDITIVKYLDTLFTEEELSKVIQLLGISPIELVRKNEAIWKENYKGKTFTDQELITILCKNPKLIERPIVIKGDKAIIGRPPQKVIDIL